MITKIIAFTGKKQSGKDTCADILQANWPDKSVSFVRISFAHILYEEVAKACGVSILHIKENKKLYRPILQWWGTEFRRGQNPNYWIDKWLAFIEGFGAYCNKEVIILVPDLRFQNELITLSDKNAYVYRVAAINREESKLNIFDNTKHHQSEIELDEKKFECIINDFHNIENTQKEIQKLIKNIC